MLGAVLGVAVSAAQFLFHLPVAEHQGALLGLALPVIALAIWEWKRVILSSRLSGIRLWSRKYFRQCLKSVTSGLSMPAWSNTAASSAVSSTVACTWALRNSIRPVLLSRMMVAMVLAWLRSLASGEKNGCRPSGYHLE